MVRYVIAAIFALMGAGLIVCGIRLLIDASKSLHIDKEILKILYEQLIEIGVNDKPGKVYVITKGPSDGFEIIRVVSDEDMAKLYCDAGNFIYKEYYLDGIHDMNNGDILIQYL